jgi:cytochrome c2
MRRAATDCAWLLALAGAGCTQHEPPRPAPVADADAQRGRKALEQFDCGVCHVIPAVPGARGQVGPSLQHYARRAYVAGKFPNEPAHLVRWIMDPPALAPRTAMPATGVSEAQARDMAAYLLALR